MNRGSLAGLAPACVLTVLILPLMPYLPVLYEWGKAAARWYVNQP